ncbi:hypothetical protein HRI_003637600 [Hibiscus trionum]|uniref:RING-type E3 ubiquitin transferase n=1 Tax=Hibiscus trionum TaxID=183268 RepID=A0A9W7ITB9_HIBTR|nr:hypothetical protein HRI_003637600 [Hibiscus trionum]
MASLNITIRQNHESCSERPDSKIPFNLFHIDLEIRCISSLHPETTLETYNRSVAVRRDMFLSEENVRDIVHSIVADWGSTPEFVDTVIVPDMLSYALYANGLPVNLGRQVIKWRIEILIETCPDDEIDELIDESLTSSVKFKPASKSSIEALKRDRYWDDEDEHHLPLKKRRKLVEGSSSRKACTVCLDEFSDGDEVASMPCNHVYHYNCIVEWLETSHLCPLCRYQMPVD